MSSPYKDCRETTSVPIAYYPWDRVFLSEVAYIVATIPKLNGFKQQLSFHVHHHWGYHSKSWPHSEAETKRQQFRPLLAMTLSRKGSVEFCIGSRDALGCNTHHLHYHSRFTKHMVTGTRMFRDPGGTRLSMPVVGIPSGFNTIQGAFPDPSTVI